MRSALEILAPALNELAFGIENHHRVAALARCVDGVVDVDVAVRILANSVCVAVLDFDGKITQVVSDFPDVVARAEDRLPCSSFVGCTKYQGSTCPDGKKERASG